MWGSWFTDTQKAAEASAQVELSEWQMFKRALNWDGFKDFWSEGLQDVKETVSESIRDTAKDFAANLTGTDHAAAADEASKRFQEYKQARRTIAEEKSPWDMTETEMIQDHLERADGIELSQIV